jgi:hypothetical protein
MRSKAEVKADQLINEAEAEKLHKEMDKIQQEEIKETLSKNTVRDFTKIVMIEKVSDESKKKIINYLNGTNSK